MTFEKVTAFVKRWSWLALVGLGSLLTWILTHRSPRKVVRTELRTLQAEETVQKVIAEQGRDAALAQVQADYEKKKRNLHDEEREQAEMLKSDPIALARWLASIQN